MMEVDVAYNVIASVQPVEDCDFFENLRNNDVNLPTSITYMDYAGAGLTTKSQMKAVFDELIYQNPIIPGIPGSIASTNGSPGYEYLTNPHSGGKLGHYTSSRIDALRNMILGHCQTDSIDYDVVFTANATASLKLVGENFNFALSPTVGHSAPDVDVDVEEKGCLCYAMNSHTSVVGLRQYAPRTLVVPAEVASGAISISVETLDTKDHPAATQDTKDDPAATQDTKDDPAATQDTKDHPAATQDTKDHPAATFHCRREHNSLFVSPAECNFSGRRANLSVVGEMVAAANARVGRFVDAGSSLQGWLYEQGAVDVDAHSSCGNTHTVSQSSSKSRETGVEHRWYWCLDASKWLSTSVLDLSRSNNFRTVVGPYPNSETKLDIRPHFVVFSMYKMFGYPTGVGVLLVKRDSFSVLNKRYFGGGTVATVAADRKFVVYPHTRESDSKTAAVDIHSSFEDGTANYHGITAVRHGFEMLQRYGGMSRVCRYVTSLYGFLLQRMQEMVHESTTQGTCSSSSGFIHTTKLFIIYSLPVEDSAICSHGPVITFNCLNPRGDVVGYNTIYRYLSKHVSINNTDLRVYISVCVLILFILCTFQDIIVRAGCFCNMGACQYYLNLTADDIISNYQSGRTCVHSSGEYTGEDENEDEGKGEIDGPVTDIINGKPTGAIRISLGMYSTIADCYRFLSVMKLFMTHLAADELNESSRLLQDDAQRMQLRAAAAAKMNIINAESRQETSVAIGAVTTADTTTETEIETETETESCEDVTYISRLFVYPIKSCGSFEVTKWPVNSNGLLFDREFVLVRAPKSIPNVGSSGAVHLVLTQKSYPKLSLLKPVIHLNLETDGSGGSAVMIVHAPTSSQGLQPLKVPLFNKVDTEQEVQAEAQTVAEARNNENSDSTSTMVNICGRKCGGRLMSRNKKSVGDSDTVEDINYWFSRYLGFSVILVRSNVFQLDKDKSTTTSTTTKSEPAVNKLGNYANDAPFLLVSMASVAHLQRVLRSVSPEISISVEQFRPNIVVTSRRVQASMSLDQEKYDMIVNKEDSAHLEDSWKSFDVLTSRLSVDIGVGDCTPGTSAGTGTPDGTGRGTLGRGNEFLSFDIIGPCARCSMINVNQGLGLLTNNLLSVLSYRKIKGTSFVGSSNQQESEGDITAATGGSGESKPVNAIRIDNNVYFGQFCRISRISQLLTADTGTGTPADTLLTASNTGGREIPVSVPPVLGIEQKYYLDMNDLYVICTNVSCHVHL